MKKPSLYLLLSCLAACSDDGGATAIDARPGTGDAGLAIDASIMDATTPDAGVDAAPPTGDIAKDLAAIPGMTVVAERRADPAGYRFFELKYQQPVDHGSPAGARFEQRIFLLHRSYDAPTVLLTNGYFTSTSGRRVELTALVNGNQVSVEHRYFVPSRPDPTDWSKLDIWQAASDHHRITVALKWMYAGRWLNTGASKSGMTAVYHRRFYPDDVDGTVAYVAPLSLGAPDPRYVAFVENAGPDPTCRQKLHDYQRLVLSPQHRPTMLANMQRLGSFDILGKDKALEHTVLELPFGLWQYSNASACSIVPTAIDNNTTIWNFLEDVGRIADYDDTDVVDFGPYYLQAANQLGFPEINEEPVKDLLKFPGTDDPEAYLPAGTTSSYDPEAMKDIDTWVKTQGRSLLFIYGEYDPWTAGAFNFGNGTSDSFKLIVPAGNHGSTIANLPPAGNAVAIDAIQRWAGLSSMPPAKLTGEVLQPMIEGRPRL